jgi:hypothetical protein
VGLEGLGKLGKNFNNLTGTRTRGLPVYSTAPQQSTLPRWVDGIREVCSKLDTVTGKGCHDAPCRVVRSFLKCGLSHDMHTPRAGFLLRSVLIFKINTYVYFYYTALRTDPE